MPMPKIFTTRLSENRDAVWAALASALDQCLLEKPLAKISLAEIAALAGIARNTTYNYARDKDGLVEAIVEHYANVIVSEVTEIAAGSQSPEERIRAIVLAILAWVADAEHRAIVGHAILGVASDFTKPPRTLMLIREQILAVAEQGAKAGAFRDNATLTWSLLSGVIHAATTQVVRQPLIRPQVETEATRIILASIRRS